PSIFLFDEPLSNLDAKLRNQMRLEIRKLQQRLGTAMIYVTHDQVEAMTLADRIVVINEGRIEQIGTPSEIYNSPASTFVASFIGAPPMNMLAGEANGSTLAIAGVDLGVEAPANGAVTLGIRPERATISAQKPSGLALPAEVDVIEELGAHRLVHVLIGPERVPFTAQQDTIEDLANGTVWLAFAREDMVFFDGESGKRL
ncbi:MAG TPA: TOBE domain-containing protein, partial [Rhodobacterales bacterium]|nr:TOBE domain-containing protein [Rhodobacterales bacterium]